MARDGYNAGLYFLKKSVRLLWVKYLVTVHYRHQIFSLGQIDDVMRISGQHVNTLDVITAYLKLYNFIGTNLTFLDQPMSSNHDKELPLGVVPVLTLGGA